MDLRAPARSQTRLRFENARRFQSDSPRAGVRNRFELIDHDVNDWSARDPGSRPGLTPTRLILGSLIPQQLHKLLQLRQIKIGYRPVGHAGMAPANQVVALMHGSRLA